MVETNASIVWEEDGTELPVALKVGRSMSFVVSVDPMVTFGVTEVPK